MVLIISFQILDILLTVVDFYTNMSLLHYYFLSSSISVYNRLIIFLIKKMQFGMLFRLWLISKNTVVIVRYKSLMKLYSLGDNLIIVSPFTYYIMYASYLLYLGPYTQTIFFKYDLISSIVAFVFLYFSIIYLISLRTSCSICSDCPIKIFLKQ